MQCCWGGEERWYTSSIPGLVACGNLHPFIHIFPTENLAQSRLEAFPEPLMEHARVGIPMETEEFIILPSFLRIHFDYKLTWPFLASANILVKLVP